MEIFLIRLLQFMLAISLLVLLHEGGHFFFSKLFGVRVEKFYLFFDPWFHLFEFKPKKSDTTYGIGWLPLGGYCKISGMVDESFDTEQMKQSVQSYEFRSKPAWQRLLIMIGGVLVNFLLALFIYSMVLFYWGDSYIPTKNMNMGMKFNEQAKEIGFKDGDILLNTDSKTFKGWDGDMYRAISSAKTVDVLRNGKKVTVNIPDGLSLLTMLKSDPKFTMPLIPSKVDSVIAGSPAAKANIKTGDMIVSMNGKTIDSWFAYHDIVGRLSDKMTSAKTSKDSMLIRSVKVVYTHKTTNAKDTANILMTPDLKLGLIESNILDYYKPVQINYGFFESFPAGIMYGCHVLRGYVGDLKYVFTSDGAKSLGGFGAIGSLFPPTWDWMIFWQMTAFLSIILAFMNILPIPALDGGHVLFLCYEIITGRKPSDKFMIRAEYVGISILLLLMIVANMNDILRWLGYM
ncbi:MAG: RIP metalloprotease RseP [Prevotella sp.]|nr:RIP metalloprotease RseP [Prevotella sp.]